MDVGVYVAGVGVGVERDLGVSKDYVFWKANGLSRTIGWRG